ncbi:MAG: OmpA family protein [Planctomycetota bacterium]
MRGCRVGSVRVGSVLAGSLAMIGLLGGCKSVPRAEYNAAVQENTELRNRRDALAESLERSETEKAQLQTENARLSRDLDEAQGALTQARDTSYAASLPSGAELRGSDVVVRVAGELLFASGSVELKSEGKIELDRVARDIQSRYPGAKIRVEGYTDSDPIRRSDWKTNERLSAERAMAVETYLVSRGIDANDIYSAAMGSASPRSTKQASRRVEIVLLGQG